MRRLWKGAITVVNKDLLCHSLYAEEIIPQKKKISLVIHIFLNIHKLLFRLY